MRYLAAYILATLGGSKDPSLNDLTSILSSVGVEVDKDRANKVISELKGKEMAKLIEEGTKKLASVPSGGGAAAPAAAAGDKEGSPSKGAKQEAKKEEKDEESDEDMGFGLFD